MNKEQKTAQKRLKKVEAELNAAFPERKALIRGALTALLAEEHVLMLGPPGTAKSLFARTLADCVAKGSFFEVLLTKFTTPEEVYGPVSFKGLKEDRYERILDGYAASTEVCFFDEFFKASSSILNCNLTLMQERMYHNAGKPVRTPLKMLLAASNEYPQDDSLKAVYDRFAVKYWVDYIGDEDAMATLLRQGGIKPVTAKIENGDLERLRDVVRDMPFDNGAIDIMLQIKSSVTEEGLLGSDRTWIKAASLVKARAVLAGRDHPMGPDFSVLSDMLWREHKDRPKLVSLVGNAADPYGSRAEAIIDGVRAAMSELPDLSLLKTGQKSKSEIIAIISKVNAQVSCEFDRVRSVQDEAKGNVSVDEAAETVKAAIESLDVLMREVTFYREKK